MEASLYRNHKTIHFNEDPTSVFNILSGNTLTINLYQMQYEEQCDGCQYNTAVFLSSTHKQHTNYIKKNPCSITNKTKQVMHSV